MIPKKPKVEKDQNTEDETMSKLIEYERTFGKQMSLEAFNNYRSSEDSMNMSDQIRTIKTELEEKISNRATMKKGKQTKPSQNVNTEEDELCDTTWRYKTDENFNIQVNTIVEYLYAEKPTFLKDKNKNTQSPKIPILSPAEISDFLRQSRGLDFNERECVRGGCCVSLTISASKSNFNQNNEKKRKDNFVLREAILDPIEKEKAKKGILPHKKRLCILCNWHITNELYFRFSENNRNEIEIEPTNFSFVVRKNIGDFICIQDHGVVISENGSGDGYPPTSCLPIDPSIGLFTPFKKLDPSKLSVSVRLMETALDHSIGMVKCYSETDINFR